ncbi:MAG: Crp/Fnr family transcriptional regulator [Spirochaetales bacterium]|nr:Crp/Fnr family transcriptional regulator [Spirochaetales bacterium]
MEENVLYNKYGTSMDEGKVIFKEGDIGDTMYIIKDGSVRISKNISGKEHILAVLGKGDFFGEMAIVNRVTRTATATAGSSVQLLAFNRQGFLSMVEKNAGIALNIIDKLCRRLQQANNQIQHLVKRNTRGLIALNLYYAFAEQGMEKAVLEYLRVAREFSLNLEIPQDTVINYFEIIKQQGIISVTDNKLKLVNRDKLSQLAESAGAA